MERCINCVFDCDECLFNHPQGEVIYTRSKGWDWFIFFTGVVLFFGLVYKTKVMLGASMSHVTIEQVVAEDEEEMIDYIARFLNTAKQEKEKFGIPVSIKLAQGILESNYGESRLAKNPNNNHFGIKCFSKNCKKGHCVNFSDDHHKDFFRRYDTAWESWRDHSKKVASKRYEELFKIPPHDYEGWAEGLQQLGYATDKEYSKKLIEVIRKYKLHKHDVATTR